MKAGVTFRSRRFFSRHESSVRSNAGFTLVEIVVAVLILSIGILGVAGMQSVGVRESQNTYFRSQANLLVADMAGKMRANATEAKRGANSVYLEDAPESPGCAWGAGECDPSSIAGFDLQNWESAVQSSGLPHAGQAIVSVGQINDAQGEVVTAIYDIQIFWDEAREGAQPENCAAASGCVTWRIQI